MEENELISNNQHGFRKKKLLSHIEQIFKSLNNKEVEPYI
jgi:hypothetical protein